MRVLCLLNPAAGGGGALRAWPHVARLLDGFCVEPELLADQTLSLSQQVISRLESRGPGAYDAIAGIGGDGTHSSILNGLMAFRARYGSEVPIPPYAFIPVGTGNDIAKSFGIRTREERFHSDLRRSVAAILYGADYWMDMGRVAGTYFADALTIGLDSRILRERNRQKEVLAQVPVVGRLIRGRLLYTLSAWPLWQHAPVRCRIHVDDRLWYEGPMLNLVINNTRIYAGEFDFSVEAFANDGLLDVVLFTGHTDYLAKYILAIRYNPEHVRTWSDRLARMSSRTQGKQIRVDLETPEEAQLDGEELPRASQFDITIAPRAVHIRTPAEPV